MPTELFIPETSRDWRSVAEGYAERFGVDFAVASRRVRGFSENPGGVAAVAAKDASGAISGFFGVRLSERDCSGRKITIGTLDLTFAVHEAARGDGDSMARCLSRGFAEKFESVGRPLALFAYFEDSDWWQFRRTEGFESAATGLTFRLSSGSMPPPGPSERDFEVESESVDVDLTTPRACRCDGAASSPLRHAVRATRWVVSRAGETLGEARIRDHGEHLFIADWRCRCDVPVAANRLLRALTTDGTRSAYFRVWNPTETLLEWLAHVGFRTFAGDSEPILAVRSRLPSPRRRLLLDGTYFTSAFAGEEPVNVLFPSEFRFYPPYFDD